MKYFLVELDKKEIRFKKFGRSVDRISPAYWKNAGAWLPLLLLISKL